MGDPPAANRFASIVYKIFINTAQAADNRCFARLWDRLWKRVCKRYDCSVTAIFHGRPVTVNFGYPYPVFARRYKFLNAPLVELAYQVWKSKKGSICFVDVGAAVGDTVLLLYANLPDAFQKFVCVEGDPVFYAYLQQNLKHLPSGRLAHCLLSADGKKIPDLVRIHDGTASAQGRAKVNSSTLSSLISEEVDLLKIDVDGFDGQVLLGADGLLTRCKPALIFEWHPILCNQTQNNWTDHFRALTSKGYSRFLWFTKFGHFSHFMFGPSFNEINALAEYCLADIQADNHYDIIALHDTSKISPLSLAQLGFAGNRRSFY